MFLKTCPCSLVIREIKIYSERLLYTYKTGKNSKVQPNIRWATEQKNSGNDSSGDPPNQYDHCIKTQRQKGQQGPPDNTGLELEPARKASPSDLEDLPLHSHQRSRARPTWKRASESQCTVLGKDLCGAGTPGWLSVWSSNTQSSGFELEPHTGCGY